MKITLALLAVLILINCGEITDSTAGLAEVTDTIIVHDTTSKKDTIVNKNSVIVEKIVDTTIFYDSQFVVLDTILFDTNIFIDTTILFDTNFINKVIDTSYITDTTFIIEKISIVDTSYYIDTTFIIEKSTIIDTTIAYDTITTLDTLVTFDTISVKDTSIVFDTISILDTILVSDTVVVVIPTDSVITFSITTTSVTTTVDGTYDAKLLGSVTSISTTGTYGGWLGKNVGATGYFHLKEVDERWTFVDPEGYLFYSTGVTSVVQGGGITLPDDLKERGINVLGNWSDEDIAGIPFSPRYSFLSNFKSTTTERKDLFEADIFPVFDPEFASWVDEAAEDFTSEYKDNEWVIGYYTDNELRFHYVDITNYLALDNSDANSIAAEEWMITKHGSLTSVTDEDIEDFRAYVAEVYMSTVNSALKKHDPNHLNLGCRIHAAVKFDEKLVEAIGSNVDVNSINFYNRWEPSADDMDMWIDSGTSPFLISEFYTKATDSGLGNEDGAGWQVDTQQDRAYHFQNMAITLLSHRGSVGWTWFKYIDKNDANKGMVDIDYNWYTTLTASMANVGKDLYNLREYLFEN